jgi:hypothetical protein
MYGRRWFVRKISEADPRLKQVIHFLCYTSPGCMRIFYIMLGDIRGKGNFFNAAPDGLFGPGRVGSYFAVSILRLPIYALTPGGNF